MQHALLEQGLDEVAEQRLVEKLWGIQAMQDRQALGHHHAQVFQPSALRLFCPLLSSSEVAM